MALGVCSWSLKPANGDELLQLVSSLGVKAIQIALDPFRRGESGWRIDEFGAAARNAGVEIRSGMIGMLGEDYSTLQTIRDTGGVRLDANWRENLANANASADIAARLGVPLVTFHAGFFPEAESDPIRRVMLDRIRAIHDVFAARGVRVGLETGQETATTLLAALRDLDVPVGVNFDPANILLYGMGDPIDALRRLAPHVAQAHIKDARRSRAVGEWGEDVVVGTGEVNFAAMFDVMREAGARVDYMIERERGKARIEDIQTALAHVRPLMEQAEVA
ncbi:MAG: TIM barrel protein [Phycisphaerales bacterium]|nr:TIM barrel protein [Phycisphaerales bacterium]